MLSHVWLFATPWIAARQVSLLLSNHHNTNNLRYADNTALLAESTEKLNSPLMKVKEESEKAGLKLNIQKTKIMGSGPITSWLIDGEKWQILFS